MTNEFSTDIDVVAFEFLAFPTITMLVDEDALTVTANVRLSQSGAKDTTHAYTDEMVEGNLVVSNPALDLTVQNRAAETTVLGVANSDSAPLEGIELTQLLDSVNSPFASPDNLNQVVVEVFGLVLRKFLMGSGASSVVPGNAILWSGATPNGVDLGTTGNGTYVLTAAAAGEDVLVVMLHQGVLA